MSPRNETYYQSPRARNPRNSIRHTATPLSPLWSSHPPLPLHLLPASPAAARLFSTTSELLSEPQDDSKSPSRSPPTNPDAQPTTEEGAAPAPTLTHLSPAGAAHMVSIAHKQPTTRTARAVCAVHFSHPLALRLIRENGHKKGDVLGVARVAGIMAAKRTPDLIPLCHPVMLSHVSVELEPRGCGGGDAPGGGGGGGEQHVLDVSATVTCDGKTGVEMEALTAASAAALTVYDMCKAVDKGMRVEGLRVVLKEGGKSGKWVEGMKTE